MSLALDVLNGVPAIVIGIFVYGLFVLGHGQSGYAASFALACLMLPLVARSTMEVLVLVPTSLREASLALGVARWRTTLSIVLPQTIGGIVTGTVQPWRASQERPHRFSSPRRSLERRCTGPHHALQTVPVVIFELSESADPQDHARAWAAALVLLIFILVTSLIARWLATRSRSKLSTSR